MNYLLSSFCVQATLLVIDGLIGSLNLVHMPIILHK